jgi:hypothetical protein
LYCTRQILESDALAADVPQRPQIFVRKVSDRDYFRKCVKMIVDDIVIDLNAEIDTYGDDFDYRDKLRDAEWAKDLSKKVVGDHLKLVKRGRIQCFAEEWAKKP